MLSVLTSWSLVTLMNSTRKVHCIRWLDNHSSSCTFELLMSLHFTTWNFSNDKLPEWKVGGSKQHPESNDPKHGIKRYMPRQVSKRSNPWGAPTIGALGEIHRRGLSKQSSPNLELEAMKDTPVLIASIPRLQLFRYSWKRVSDNCLLCSPRQSVGFVFQPAPWF